MAARPSDMTPARTSIIARIIVSALLASTLAVMGGIGPAAAVDPPAFVSKWGTHGTTAGNFVEPQFAAVDADGNVYVTDGGNDRVQKFTASGSFITQWGSHGWDNGEFNQPRGIAIALNGNVLVVDRLNARVQEFTPSGTFVTAWESADPHELDGAEGIAVDSAGHIYVAVTNRHQIQEFSAAGGFLAMWGSEGTANGQFSGPTGIVVDDADNVYVTDSGNDRVQKFTSRVFVAKWGSVGSAHGRFNSPSGIAVDNAGNIDVVDSVNSRVQQFTPTGTFITTWGTEGSANGRFRTPLGVAVSAADDVYVVDMELDRVQRFRPPAPHPQPDGRIKLGATGTYVGENVYNTTGAGQTVTGRAPNLHSVTYYVSVQNDGVVAETIRVKASTSTSTYSVKYKVDGVNVTPAMTAGTYRTPTLAPGAAVLVKVVVTVGRLAPPPSTWTGSLISKSNTDPSQRDTVKFFTMNRPT